MHKYYNPFRDDMIYSLLSLEKKKTSGEVHSGAEIQVLNHTIYPKRQGLNSISKLYNIIHIFEHGIIFFTQVITVAVLLNRVKGRE